MVTRTKEAVRLLDHQNYRRLQKMLMSGDSISEENEIESEPPRLLLVIRGLTAGRGIEGSLLGGG